MTGGSGSAGSGSGSTLAAGSQSVLQRGNDLQRHATFTESGLTKPAGTTAGTATMMAPDSTFNMNATLPTVPGSKPPTPWGMPNNQGTPSVLYLENGPVGAGCPMAATGCKATGRAAGAGVFFAFAPQGANPNVFAFDETTGQPVWTAHVNNGSDGIRGTPAVDPVSRRLFVVAGNPHVAHALSVDTGVEQTTGGWPVMISPPGFNSGAANQHGASLLMNNILYVPFGGQYGDGGSYNGWVMAINTMTGQLSGWETQNSHAGIWGAGGPVSDGTTNVFEATGDDDPGNIPPRGQSDSEELVRLTGMASFTRSAENVFVPTEWYSWDRDSGHDLDFGASTASYVELPAGSTPSAILVAAAKAGRVFILDATNLSSGAYSPTTRQSDGSKPNGGALADIVTSNTTGESQYTSPTIYTSASGLHATVNVGQGSPAGCKGGGGGEALVSIGINTSQPGSSSVVWCAALANGGNHMNYVPISTTSDGVSADAIVWVVDGAQLRAIDGDTGANIATTTGAGCMNIPSMSYPIAVKNRIVVAALGNLCSWSVNGN